MVIVKEIIRTYYDCDENVKYDIDSTIAQLSKDGELSDIELVVLSTTKEQYSLKAAGELLGISKSATGRALDSACNKIAEYLGSEYQDEKILKLAEKKLCRKLTTKEQEFCWKKIKDFGRNRYSDVNIFNFKIKDGKIVGFKDKAEG